MPIAFLKLKPNEPPETTMNHYINGIRGKRGGSALDCSQPRTAKGIDMAAPVPLPIPASETPTKSLPSPFRNFYYICSKYQIKINNT